tara:strand:- start:154 stop:720 length:567 start_codon:yes stop_codon:yes gene_type:complete
MKLHNLLKTLTILLIINLTLNSCGLYRPVDAKKYPPDPKERVKKNLEEGKGFRLSSKLKQMGKGGGDFEFSSSNELWRASLDVLDFMPLATANYSGGIIVTDWYSEDFNSNESIKITIRFLTNEIRSDAIDLKIFYKVCKSQTNCSITEKTGQLVNELTKEILKQAAIYEKTKKDENFKPYKVIDPKK